MSRAEAEVKAKVVLVPKNQADTRFVIKQDDPEEVSAWKFASWISLRPFRSTRLATEADIYNLKVYYLPETRSTPEYPAVDANAPAMLFFRAAAKKFFPGVESIIAITTDAFKKACACGSMSGEDYKVIWEVFIELFPFVTVKDVGNLVMSNTHDATFAECLVHLKLSEDFSFNLFMAAEVYKRSMNKLKPAAAAAPTSSTPIASAQPQEEGKEQSVEEMVEERINVAFANRGFTGGRGGRGGRGNRRAGMHGGAPNKPAAAYFKDNKRVISPSCRDCGMAPHGGPCQVVRCDMECFHCHNKGHRFTVCNHPGAYNTRTPSSTRS